ncbi:MAG: C40 family peptidase [Candidatus Krumholzibacteria bacterium]|nr:C40 family peptidase [Candidatus Krumholzibacteria bacterium]
MKRLLEILIDNLARSRDELGFDWRTCWSRVTPESDGRVVVDVSRPEQLEVLESVSVDFGVMGKSPGELVMRSRGGVEVIGRVAGASSGTVLWVVSSVADLRREPEHSAELLTQAIMGETLILLETRGDWFFVMTDDHYHGWIRSWYVSETSVEAVRLFAERADARVEASVAYVLSSPEETSIPVTDVTAGTRVKVELRKNGFATVQLPGGKSGFLKDDALIDPVCSKDRRSRIVERVGHFAGIPYIWGGTSAKGFDCSGLVKRVFEMEGVDLPRDADQQSVLGRMIPYEDLGAALPGDLLFFGEGGKITHVSIALGKGRFVHAYGDVRFNSYLPDDSLYEEKLAGKLLFGRSIIDP